MELFELFHLDLIQHLNNMAYTDILNLPEYSFLKDNPHLGNKICLVGMGGSIAYGTNLPTSDVDISRWEHAH